MDSKAQIHSYFLIRPPRPPPTRYPHPPNPLQSANFANFGLIWMKLGVEVKNGEQSLNLEGEVGWRDFTTYQPTQPPRPKQPQMLTQPILVQF